MDYLPPAPTRRGAAGRRPLHSGRLPSSRPSTTADPPGGADDPRAGAEAASAREKANRKCPYCNAPAAARVPSQPVAGSPRGAPGRGAGPGSATTTPHPGPAPEVHAGRARRLRGTTSPGPAIPPSRPGPERTGTPRRARPARIGTRAATWRGLPGRLEQLSGRRFQASSARPCPPWLGPRDAPSGRSLPREKLLTPHGGRARLSSTPPGNPRSARAARREHPRAGRQSVLHGTKKKKKMSRRVTGQPPPRPTPCAAGRTRCLPPRPRRSAPGTHRQLQPPRRGGEGRARAGPHTIWQSTAAAPAARRSRLRDTQPRAGSGSCGGGRRSTTSPSRSPASSLLPAPLPWQRGAKALGPAPSFRPASRGSPRPPSCLLAGRRPPPPGYPEGGWGKVASGRAGRARKAGWGTPRARSRAKQAGK